MLKTLIYVGKVRSIYLLDNNRLCIVASDRLSSFDKHICNIKHKGNLLNLISAYWFEKTAHIISNHMLSIDGPEMIVKQCTPFKIEVVVRGYITGNTETSLWTHYNRGIRNYCGIDFPEGLKKNQKLECAVVTPTTKDISDVPISKIDIVENGYMTNDECDYVYEKAVKLFEYGQMMADKAGFILVDTKYEFGKDVEGNILLIDELHTCDSSRYWVKETYIERFENNLEPEKIDKDCIRDWVKSKCNPYEDTIPEIPIELIEKTKNIYKYFFEKITQT